MTVAVMYEITMVRLAETGLLKPILPIVTKNASATIWPAVRAMATSRERRRE